MLTSIESIDKMFAVHYTTELPDSFAPRCEAKVSDIQGQSFIALISIA